MVAALLGSWLLPQITRQWQDHQKALEIQTGLVSDMSTAVSSAVATSRFVAAGLVAGPGEQQAWNNAYRDWTTRSAAIGAKLRAYVGSDVGGEWQSFGYAVTDYVLLSAQPKAGSGRVAQVAEIYGYRDRLPGTQLSRSDWTTLAATRSGSVFQDAYAALGRGLLARQDELVERVLDSHVSGF